MAITIDPKMQVIANATCKKCDHAGNLTICGHAVLLRMRAGRMLAVGNMYQFEARKQEFMRHTEGN